MAFFLFIYHLGQQAPRWHCTPFGSTVINSRTLFLQINDVATIFIVHRLI